MKKITSAVLTLVLLLSMLPLQGYSAQVKITEESGLKLIVNGKVLNLNTPILNMNGAILAPAAEFLPGLGVPADSSHIKLDSKKKKAVVSWKGLNVTFRAGSKSAYVGGKSAAMDTFCINYAKNKKMYVPLTFTARLFGYRVIRDTAAKAIYLRESSTFDRNMKLLKSINTAMSELARLKVKTLIKLELSGGGNKAVFNIDSLDEVDKEGKRMHSLVNIPVFGNSVALETFYYNNGIYTRDAANQSWNVTRLNDGEFNRLLDEDTSLSVINTMDILAASMDVTADTVQGRTVLKGSVYPKRLIDGISTDTGIEKLQPQVYNVEAYVNGTTYLVESLHMEVSGSCTAKGGFTHAGAIIDADYTEPDGSFEVQIPEW